MIKKFSGLIIVMALLSSQAVKAEVVMESGVAYTNAQGVTLIKSPPEYKSFRNLGSAARRLSATRPGDIVGFFNDGAATESIVDYARVQELFEQDYHHAGTATEIGNRIWTDQLID